MPEVPHLQSQFFVSIAEPQAFRCCAGRVLWAPHWWPWPDCVAAPGPRQEQGHGAECLRPREVRSFDDAALPKQPRRVEPDLAPAASARGEGRSTRVAACISDGMLKGVEAFEDLANFAWAAATLSEQGWSVARYGRSRIREFSVAKQAPQLTVDPHTTRTEDTTTKKKQQERSYRTKCKLARASGASLRR